MPRTKSPNGPLRDALVWLIESQARLVEAQAARDREMAARDKEVSELRKQSDERFARIEAILLRLVEVLPEAVRDRIGLKGEPK
jgi:hypothetical protein